MANTNAPFGCRLHSALSGTVNDQLEWQYNGIDKDDTAVIGFGDPLKRLSTGYMACWTAGTAVSQLAGIFAGCEYLSISQGKRIRNNYWPGSDASGDVDVIYVPINLAIPSKFLIQTNSTGVVLADIGANFDLTMATASTLTGQSVSYIDVSSLNTTATLPFRLVGLASHVMKGNGSQAGAYNVGIFAANSSGAGSTGI